MKEVQSRLRVDLRKRMSKIIGIDIDGVISDIAGHLVRYVKDMFEYEILLEEITSENIETCSNLSGEQVKEIFCNPQFFQSLPAFSSAKDSLHRLVKAGWEIILMTDRFWYAEIHDDTLTWLKQNDIPFHSTHFVSKAEKAVWARKLGIKYFIEDQLSNANLLSEVCDQVFLVDRPYNQGATLPAISRISSVREAVDRLLAFERKRASG